MPVTRKTAHVDANLGDYDLSNALTDSRNGLEELDRLVDKRAVVFLHLLAYLQTNPGYCCLGLVELLEKFIEDEAL